MTSSGLKSLTSLRFFAAIIIVFFHATLSFEYNGPRILVGGHTMLTFFFTLSGFILYYAQTLKPKFSTRNFFIDRFSRAYPMYFLAFWFAFYIRPIDFEGGFLHLAFLQSFVPGQPMRINPPAWTLGCELVFYILFPFLYRRLGPGKDGYWKFAALSCALLFTSSLISFMFLRSSLYTGFASKSHDLINYFPLLHLPPFLVGMSGCALLLNRNWNPSALSAGVAFLVTLGFMVFDGAIDLHGGSNLISLFIIIWMTYLVRIDNFITKTLSCAPLVAAGSMTYSIYILQNPMRDFSRMLAGNLGLPTHGYMFSLMYMMTLLLVAKLTFTAVEEPLKRLIRVTFK